MENPKPPITAAGIARERLEKYINGQLKTNNAWDDLCAWHFYNYLLEQAIEYKIDYSGYGPFQYQDDRREAAANCRTLHPDNFASDDKSKEANL